MPKLKDNGELTLSQREVHDLRALIYEYGQNQFFSKQHGAPMTANQRCAVIKMRQIRCMLPILDDKE